MDSKERQEWLAREADRLLALDTKRQRALRRLEASRLRSRKVLKLSLKKESLVTCPMPKDEWTQGARQRLVEKDNEAEAHVKKLLRACGFVVSPERPISVMGKRYFIDFLVTSIKEGSRREKLRVAVEVDGGYHFTPEQQEKDRIKDSLLLKSVRVRSILRIKSTVAMRLTSDDIRAAVLDNPIGGVTFMYE